MASNTVTRYPTSSCNIGSKEVKKRYTSGIIDFLTSGVSLGFFILYNIYYLFSSLLLGFIQTGQEYFKVYAVNAYTEVCGLSDGGVKKYNKR